MNAYKIVETIFNTYDEYIGENDLKQISGKEYPIVVAILVTHYEGKYIPSQDIQCCGIYKFKNPLALIEEKGYSLSSCFYNSNKFDKIMDTDNLDNLFKEIVRLEYNNIYWDNKTKIPEYIQKVRKKSWKVNDTIIFLGNKRIWKIIPYTFYKK